MSTSDSNPSRRAFLAAGATGASLFALAQNRADAQEVSAELKEHEQANIKLVNEFCDAWETMDVDKLASFLADDVTFRMIDTSPRIEGKAALVEGTRQFLAPRKSARFEVLRSEAIGNLVINERIDHFEREDGKDAFHVAGFFLVKDGKIVEWQDYMMPDLG